MKIIIVLSIIQIIGLISSWYLSGSFAVGFEDNQTGILIVAGLWIVYAIYKHVKKEKVSVASKN